MSIPFQTLKAKWARLDTTTGAPASGTAPLHEP
jgi:hypothetical protein